MNAGMCFFPAINPAPTTAAFILLNADSLRMFQVPSSKFQVRKSSTTEAQRTQRMHREQTSKPETAFSEPET
jgi:hypothetical protein